MKFKVNTHLLVETFTRQFCSKHISRIENKYIKNTMLPQFPVYIYFNDT